MQLGALWDTGSRLGLSFVIVAVSELAEASSTREPETSRARTGPWHLWELRIELPDTAQIFSLSVAALRLDQQGEEVLLQAGS